MAETGGGESGTVTVELADGVADVRLDRPGKMNALDPALFAALLDAADRLAAEPSLRAVVLSGEGRAFCAGLDLGSMARLASRDGAEDLLRRSHGPANRFQQAALAWRACPVPVIAAVHGTAFGGGFQIALGADIRIVSPDARLSVAEIRWGLVPDMGGTLLMRELARADIVRELTFTGRVFDGEEALRLGFATRLSADPRAEALALAREIAGQSPDAVRAAKRLLNGLTGPEETARILLRETEEQAALLGSPGQRAALAAGLSGRGAGERGAAHHGTGEAGR